MFRLHSPYSITPAQQNAVSNIIDHYRQGKKKQVLLGVTGSGKTFSMAQIIKELALPTLVLAPNKTLAAQLYQEFRSFFPESLVGYFVSYYDYYQPEAYVPQKNLYLAKEVSINPDLERLRITATRNLLESRDTVVVASVSAIYNIGSPDEFSGQKASYSVGEPASREQIAGRLVSLGYTRTNDLLAAGKFRLRGDTVEIHSTSEDDPIRLSMAEDKISEIARFDAITAEIMSNLPRVNIFPISFFYTNPGRLPEVSEKIRRELFERVNFFEKRGEKEFAERINQRTLFDLEMLEQLGYCAGIENYSLYLSNRRAGTPPYTILDYFPSEFLVIIDESHISVPQLNGMYAGDRSRKRKLVDYGFRLPSALENRPLHFAEFQAKTDRVLYVSATPAEFESEDADGGITELLVRPTGLLDPEITIKNSTRPVKDMLQEIEKVRGSGRTLVTTLTKKMSEKLADYLSRKGIQCAYLHSEIKALDRIKVIKKLRSGEIDVLIGINLLREGLDLPEVALVIILDADKEGFLRSTTSLIQTFGRAARNLQGRVILYLDEMTAAVRQALAESERRRVYQLEYNHKYNIIPASIAKKIQDFSSDDYWIRKSEEKYSDDFVNREALQMEIDRLSVEMRKKADALEFKSAAALRDRIKVLKNLLIEMY